jgi:Crp-like helix-turn-helix domain
LRKGDVCTTLFFIKKGKVKHTARALLLLANFGVEVKPDRVLTGMSQETLAAMVGTTRARVNFFMNKFRKLGLLDYNGGIQIRFLVNRGSNFHPKIFPRSPAPTDVGSSKATAANR